LHGHLAGDGGRGSHQSGKLGRFGGIVGPKAGVVGEHDGKDREKTGYEKKKQLFLLINSRGILHNIALYNGVCAEARTF
jgi:hypothetical protein